jgi:hypothetical protein
MIAVLLRVAMTREQATHTAASILLNPTPYGY